MSDSWDNYADSWDDNPDVIEYSKKAFESLGQYVNPAGLDVLDFGCGTGLLTEKLASMASSVVAVDTSVNMIAVLKNKQLDNVNAIACDISLKSIEQHPILASGFDLIVASSVCAFVPEYDKTLAEIKHLLKKGGMFVQWDWKRSHEDDDFGFSQDIIARAYDKAGLSIVDVSEIFSMSNEQGTMQVLVGVAKKD